MQGKSVFSFTCKFVTFLNGIRKVWVKFPPKALFGYEETIDIKFNLKISGVYQYSSELRRLFFNSSMARTLKSWVKEFLKPQFSKRNIYQHVLPYIRDTPTTTEFPVRHPSTSLPPPDRWRRLEIALVLRMSTWGVA